MIDAGGQRLYPFQVRRATQHGIFDGDAETDQSVDVGKVAAGLRRTMDQRKLQLRKFLAQPVAIGLGVNINDEDF